MARALAIASYEERFPALAFADRGAGVLEIRLARPGRLNAADADMHRDLSRVFRAAGEDEAVSVVLVRGEGGQFSAGGDFSLIEEMIADDDAWIRVFDEARELVYGIIDCRAPVVAAVEGVAVGAGLAVALLADISVAGESARLLDGHVKLGVAAGDHSVIIWPLLIGMARAKYHLLTNTPIRGREAAAMGLVSLAVPDEEVVAKAEEIAFGLARGSRTAVRFTKQALNNWIRLAGPAFDASLAMEFMGFRLADIREGLAALKDKRPPRFPSAQG